jgi:hypothetical protein
LSSSLSLSSLLLFNSVVLLLGVDSSSTVLNVSTGPLPLSPFLSALGVIGVTGTDPNPQAFEPEGNGYSLVSVFTFGLLEVFLFPELFLQALTTEPKLDFDHVLLNPLSLRLSFSSLSLFNSSNVSAEGLNHDLSDNHPNEVVFQTHFTGVAITLS